MSWQHWRDDFDEADLTLFEQAQVLGLQQVVREYETAQRALTDLLYWLATRIAPGEVDRRLTRNPFAFSTLSPEGWRRFFENALQHAYLIHGPMPVLQRLREENQRLREQIAQLRAPSTPSPAPGAPKQPPVDASPPAASPEETPVIPAQPPGRYASLFSQDATSLRRELIFLSVLAAKGYSAEVSLRWELVQRVEALSHPDSGSIKRLIARLAKRNLIHRHSVSMGQHRLNIVTLSELGAEVVRAMGVPQVESEWARLMRLHGGQAQEKHAAQVCLFTHLARQRGWRTQVCPETLPPADPDALIEKDDERIYVEVEAGSGSPERRMRKWRNLRNLQGFVAICAPSEHARRALVREARSNVKRGMATDFAWLREHPDAGLWAETW